MPNILVCYTYHQVALEGLSGEKIIKNLWNGKKWVDFFCNFLFLCLRMASHLVGKCLKFNKILCRTFWYAILTTRWLWKVSVVKKSSKISEMAKNEWIFFAIFCFCASEWPRTWLESVSNLIKFHAEHFGMLYLPPGGSGRSQWWKNHQKSLKWQKMSGFFLQFFVSVPPNGLAPGWKVSQI